MLFRPQECEQAPHFGDQHIHTSGAVINGPVFIRYNNVRMEPPRSVGPNPAVGEFRRTSYSSTSHESRPGLQEHEQPQQEQHGSSTGEPQASTRVQELCKFHIGLFLTLYSICERELPDVVFVKSFFTFLF